MDEKSLSLKRKRWPVTQVIKVMDNSLEDSPGDGQSLEDLQQKVYKDDHFNFNMTSKDLSRYMEGETSANAEKSTAWALNNFKT